MKRESEYVEVYGDLDGLIGRLQVVQTQITMQRGRNVTVRVDSDNDIDIEFDRPETEAEIIKRRDQERRDRERAERKAREEREIKELRLRELARELNFNIERNL